MRITLLGHATLLVEADGANLVMDPVFYDPFEASLTLSCPRRKVNVSEFPRLDAVLLSHGHADHFDQRSMMDLPRDLTVYLPHDPELATKLSAEGFSKLKVLKPKSPFQIGNTRLLPTGSRDDDEVGIVFSDGSGSAWNQVDTATNHDMASDVATFLGNKLDVVFCPFNPLLEWAETWVSEEDFPEERYQRLLEAAIASHAHTIVPGSSGQRMNDELEWMNHRCFPVSREQFLADLGDVAPELRGLIVNPGDGVQINHGDITLQQTPYAQTLAEDTHRLIFDPGSNPPPPLIDTNPKQYDTHWMREKIQALMSEGLTKQINSSLNPNLKGPLRTLWDRRAIFQIEFVFPQGEEIWHVKQWHPHFELLHHAHPDPDYRFRYIASEVTGYINGDLTLEQCNNLRAYRRKGHSRKADGTFRLSSLDPGRLFGEDLYNVVDATFIWHPLNLF